MTKKKRVAERGRRNIFGFKNYYKESWDFLKESKKFIFASVGIFFILFLLGLILPTPQFVLDIVIDMVKKLLEETQGKGFFEMWFFIFKNNLIVAFVSVLFGCSLGIIPLLYLFGNGYFIGVVSRMVTSETSIFELWRLIPHGIFELPAIFISFGLGIKIGSFVFYENPYKKLKEFYIKSFKVFIFIIIPLLFVAAFIEAGLIVFMG